MQRSSPHIARESGNRSNGIALSDLRSKPVRAVDDRVGYCVRFYLDLRNWDLRYALVSLDIGGADRAAVLIPVFAFDRIQANDNCLYLQLISNQVLNTPVFRVQDRVPHDYETSLYRHHGWPGYWETLASDRRDDATGPAPRDRDGPIADTALMSYGLEARDGTRIGGVRDFGLDPVRWHVHALFPDTAGGQDGPLGCEQVMAIDHRGCRIRLDVEADALCRSN